MGAFQRLEDHNKHRLGIQQHIVVPEAQHPKAAFDDFGIPVRIIIALRQMLPAIDFDHYLRIDAGKIGNVIADRHLASKAKSRELPVAQVAPQVPFGGSGRFS